MKSSGSWIAKKERQQLWRKENGVVYFTLPPTDGTTGPQWIERLEQKGFRVSIYAMSVLRSPEFKPTSDVTYTIAVLKGILFAYGDRDTGTIRAEADSRKFMQLDAEVACLIREAFSDEDIEAMGLCWIVVMHNPIKCSDGAPALLLAGRDGGGRCLSAIFDDPDEGWGRGDGFAFLAPHVRC